MILIPQFHLLTEIIENLPGAQVVVWCTPSVVERVRKLVPWQVQTTPPKLDRAEWLLVVGGGKLIDQAKLLRAEHPHLKLAAIPTLWGSGAEASPIAVWSESGEKKFLMNACLLPDVVCHVPEFAESLPDSLVHWACGDAWAHALEGFLSPLASDGTRADLAEVIRGMMELGIRNDPRWFQSSALACAGQAQSSVGLIHGIAHVAESPSSLGHARLCATLLLPVMRFNQTKSPKWALLADHGLSADRILEIVSTLFCQEDYAQALAAISGRWNAVLRNPCTRTNSALVRPDDKTYFEEFAP
jgi:alcohol dehydrogenase class IV